MNKSTIFELAFRSKRQYSITDLSDMTPNALIRINSGIGFFTLGISITIWLLVYLESGAIIFAEVYLMGLELSSDTE